jgi:flagellar export protein FliJ
MRPFHFSLEQVLGYHKQLEEQAMLVFAQAVQARDKRLRENLACEEEIEKSRRKLTDIAALDADERWLISGYIAALTHDLELAVRDLVRLEEHVDRCRAELTQRAQDKKLLEMWLSP